ncbi:MAG TPA: DUF1127 domain-containing protein [Hyphomicrobiaceae bacterium]|nr:DUF1127 domain-containing protein [Hyphomicrobiaceae bacterium]
MTCQITSISRIRTEAAAINRLARVARAAGYIRRAWRGYWEWRARRVTLMLLHSLDRRTLHDIGISPGEIESLVRCGGDRGRRYDASWLWRPDGT